ncbi:MAG: SDR family NAD(P)-dependent oxidoreductase [Bacteroidota bacterium]
MINLKGKIAVVTGAAQGIGKAIARNLAEQGAKVFLTDVQEASLQKTVTELKDYGLDVAYELMDVTKPAMISEVAQKINGSYPVSILVNNAGVANDKPSLEYSQKDWDKMMAVNLTGTFHCCREFGKYMVDRKDGAIVCISSIAGVTVVRPEHHIGYDVAKAGVIQMCKTLAVEWAASNVRVNSVGPGYTDTSILEGVGSDSPETLQQWKNDTPRGSFNQPWEVAAVVSFLASPAAAAVTGQNLMADGGYSTGKGQMKVFATAKAA